MEIQKNKDNYDGIGLKRRGSYDGRRSSNSELLKSVRSRRDFWNEKVSPRRGDKCIARAKEFLDKKRE